ncbi:hypothetical protein ACGFRG_25435 [Streptomyces sp. NPDC048696]|uniref:hypothetical protein n=1 Tax=Streptomyces sp. NPDC048696 TaxID=3365585 RepID=UPI0037245776
MVTDGVAMQTSPHESTTTRAYWAEVFAEGPAGGKTVRMVLGTFPTPYRGRALRWLVRQARWIADGLDPNPDVPWLGGEFPQQVQSGLPDAPHYLRSWCENNASRQAAYDQLGSGHPFTLSATDHNGAFFLSILPVDVPASLASESPRTHRHRRTKPRRTSPWLAHFR